ncbi:hypothetical protein JCM8208_004927 [Rhodotorula glutinis]
MAQPGPVMPAAGAPAAPVAPVAPVVPKISAAVDAGFDVRIVADLELDLNDPALEACLCLDKVPLPGRWSVQVQAKAQYIRFEISHGVLSKSAHGTATCVEIELAWKDAGSFRCMHKVVTPVGAAPRVQPGTRKRCNGYFLDLTSQHIATVQQESSGSFDPTVQRKYRLTFEIRQDRRRPPQGAYAFAIRAPDSAAKALPHDVRLFFPGTEDRADAELWTTERFLTASSTYFLNLFRSGLAETVTIGNKRARIGRSPDELVSQRLSLKPLDKHVEEDSDRETDVLLFQGKLGEPSPKPHDALEDVGFPHKQVTIEQASYTTYRAVLLWLSTGYIQFASLSSSYAVTPDLDHARTSALRALHQVDTSLPVAASPKSVYRLAHILELDELEVVAMRFFHDECLTTDTATVELFSELARDHSPWRTSIIDWILAHWDEVRVSEAWVEMKRRVACDELEGAGLIFLELTERRMGG